MKNNLNVNIGDKIVLMSPSGIESIVGTLPKQDTFIIDSIFESGLIEFDDNVALSILMISKVLWI